MNFSTLGDGIVPLLSGLGLGAPAYFYAFVASNSLLFSIVFGLFCAVVGSLAGKTLQMLTEDYMKAARDAMIRRAITRYQLWRDSRRKDC